MRVDRLWRLGGILHFVPVGLGGAGGAVLCRLPILLRQRRLHDDGGPLPQVLPRRRLGGHDGFGAVHPGRRLAAEVAVRLLPAPQLAVMLLLDVLLRHGQLCDLQRQPVYSRPRYLRRAEQRARRRRTADEVPSQLGTIKREECGTRESLPPAPGRPPSCTLAALLAAAPWFRRGPGKT